MPQTEDQILAIKAALMNTTHTHGWAYVKQFANNLVQNTTQEALDEEDPTKRNDKVLKASALQKGFKELFQLLEEFKRYNPQTNQDDDGMGDLQFEQETVNS